MRLDYENILNIFLYMTFIISVVGYLAYIFKIKLSHQIEYILVKNIFLKRLKYSEMRQPKQYLSYLKYDIWRYCSLF